MYIKLDRYQHFCRWVYMCVYVYIYSTVRRGGARGAVAPTVNFFLIFFYSPLSAISALGKWVTYIGQYGITIIKGNQGIKEVIHIYILIFVYKCRTQPKINQYDINFEALMFLICKMKIKTDYLFQKYKIEYVFI